MDSSDGLADAILQICQASGVGFRLDPDLVFLDPQLRDYAPQQALDWALYGGEDFELILALPEAIAQGVVTEFPESSVLGRCTRDHDCFGLERQSTFQHFSVGAN
jgi:thiamine-monophosphate kinase